MIQTLKIANTLTMNKYKLFQTSGYKDTFV